MTYVNNYPIIKVFFKVIKLLFIYKYCFVDTQKRMFFYCTHINNFLNLLFTKLNCTIVHFNRPKFEISANNCRKRSTIAVSLEMVAC